MNMEKQIKKLELALNNYYLKLEKFKNYKAYPSRIENIQKMIDETEAQLQSAKNLHKIILNHKSK